MLAETYIFAHSYAKSFFPKGQSGIFVSYRHINDFHLQMSVVMADKEIDRSESVEINNMCV